MSIDIEPLLLGLADRGRVLTDEEFAEADFEEPWRYELEDGRLVVMSPNSEAHDDASEPWRDALVAYKLVHREIVDKIVPEAWVLVAPGRQRIGDIGVFLRGERSGIPRPERAPEILFEVVSPGKRNRKRDYVKKRDDYHRIAVREYVIIDPKRHAVTVLEYRPEGYQERILGPDDIYTTPILPGLEIPLADVL